MQLDVTKVNFPSLADSVVPGLGAAVKLPEWLLLRNFLSIVSWIGY